MEQVYMSRRVKAAGLAMMKSITFFTNLDLGGMAHAWVGHFVTPITLP